MLWRNGNAVWTSFMAQTIHPHQLCSPTPRPMQEKPVSHSKTITTYNRGDETLICYAEQGFPSEGGQLFGCLWSCLALKKLQKRLRNSKSIRKSKVFSFHSRSFGHSISIRKSNRKAGASSYCNPLDGGYQFHTPTRNSTLFKRADAEGPSLDWEPQTEIMIFVYRPISPNCFCPFSRLADSRAIFRILSLTLRAHMKKEKHDPSFLRRAKLDFLPRISAANCNPLIRINDHEKVWVKSNWILKPPSYGTHEPRATTQKSGPLTVATWPVGEYTGSAIVNELISKELGSLLLFVWPRPAQLYFQSNRTLYSYKFLGPW